MLPISLDHVAAVAALPRPHGDPLDGLLFSQAVVENIAIISVDSAFAAHPIARRS